MTYQDSIRVFLLLIAEIKLWRKDFHQDEVKKPGSSVQLDYELGQKEKRGNAEKLIQLVQKCKHGLKIKYLPSFDPEMIIFFLNKWFKIDLEK